MLMPRFADAVQAPLAFQLLIKRHCPAMTTRCCAANCNCSRVVTQQKLGVEFSEQAAGAVATSDQQLIESAWRSLLRWCIATHAAQSDAPVSRTPAC
jgi:hypothetical protein